MKFKGVLLDLDNTLYPYTPAHVMAVKKACRFLSHKTGLSYTTIEKRYLKFRGFYNKKLHGTAASHNRLLYSQSLLEDISKKYVKFSLEAYNVYWAAYINAMKLDSACSEFFRLCKGKKIAILTDLTADVQHRKMTHLKLWDKVDYLVTSEEAGCEKPSKEIFQLALQKLKLKPKDVCMIGDSFSRDIKGATSLRIPSFWINHSKEKRRLNKLITEVKSLKEVIKHLKLCK